MSKSPRGPIVSVIIPCFNAQRTIGSTLASAAKQTVRDLEIIVVDDGSTDSSPALVAAAAATDARIRLITQANGGVSAARNTGIAAASARFIALLDSDDLWAPDHLETHVRRLEADPRLGVSFSAARFIDTDGVVVGQSAAKLSGITPADLLLSNPTTTCSTLVIRRSVFKDTGPFRTTMRHNEDQEWLFRVSMSGWLMTGDPSPRVDYRTSPNGLASDLDGMYRGFLVMLEEARKLAPGLVMRHQAWATACMFRYLARRAIRLGLAPSVARHYMIRSLAARPSLVLTEPRATLATLGASLMPSVLLHSILHVARPHPA
jgi:glycosyltransferase involved in cell wall biosynthesis